MPWFDQKFFRPSLVIGVEKPVVAFSAQSVEDLVRHALRALRDTLANDQELSSKLVSVAVVGKDHPFQVYDDGIIENLVRTICLLLET